MNIRRAIPTDRDTLIDIWLRSVRATHTFLSEKDIQFFLPLVRDYLASAGPEFWVLCSDSGAPMGFLGMSGSKMDALFLAPEFHRRGGGRRLVQFAQALKGELTVDVNEQNPTACRFYEACGFVVEGRSELDDTGRPFPLLHMRQRAGALRPPSAGVESAFGAERRDPEDCAPGDIGSGILQPRSDP
jgi:putative acetyltransferase